RLLGRADLSLVLAPELASDARQLAPRRLAVVANGLAVRRAAPPVRVPADRDDRPTRVLFLGLCSAEKGVFDTLTALAIANRRQPGALHLTVAGSFASTRDQHAFFSQVQALGPEFVEHVGFADAERKHALFAAADLFCFPTCYPHEGQPLVLLEALAHDLPIVTTRWRAIPGMLPPEHVYLVDSGRPDQLADALLTARRGPQPAGKLRAHYESHFTPERHLAILAAALRSHVRSPNSSVKT
ncbi:MAG TPA: glycosyltransferase family 4 protein, partial [Opitutus sp.]|nr:glycosyltransferase family 4 protein [Opitutus sp.]